MQGAIVSTKRVFVLSVVAMLLGACAVPMKIDPAKVGAVTATLRIESPALETEKTIPFLKYTTVDIDLSTFAGCDKNLKQKKAIKKLGSATLTAKKSAQTFQVPADVELAVFAGSTHDEYGAMSSCNRALRFTAENGASYVFQFNPPFGAHGRACDMTVRQIIDGHSTELPGVHDAVVVDRGIWLGGELNLCADGR